MFKTLLVEDNHNYRRVLKNALTRRFVDLEVRVASGEIDTFDTVSTFDPDLVIMDIDLRCDVSGLDLTKVIKTEHPEIVVVILSQHDISEYRTIARQNGADFFFSKNTSLENIFDYVDSIIEHKQGSHETV